MTTKEEAIATAQKILSDIDFWDDDDVVEPRARLIEGSNLSIYEEPYWLISHYYGAEDFGPNNASAFVYVDLATGKPTNKVTVRHGSIKIAFDEGKGKYVRKK